MPTEEAMHLKICFPVQCHESLESIVFDHFGSAPMFIVVDADTGALMIIDNGDRHHARGACNPLKALDNQKIDAVVVGGIGAGALSKLSQAGIKVYRARSKTISGNLALYRENKLQEYSPLASCGGHGRGSGCSHH